MGLEITTKSFNFFQNFLVIFKNFSLLISSSIKILIPNSKIISFQFRNFPRNGNFPFPLEFPRIFPKKIAINFTSQISYLRKIFFFKDHKFFSQAHENFLPPSTISLYIIFMDFQSFLVIFQKFILLISSPFKILNLNSKIINSQFYNFPTIY